MIQALLRSALQRRRVRMGLYWLLGLGLLLVLFGYLGVPPLARWGLESQGSRLLGRAVSVGSVSFNPFTLTARLESLRIAEADGKGEFVALRALEANLDTSSIWHGGAVLKTLRVDGPVLHIVRLDGGRYNFSDILDRLAAMPKREPGEPARYSLNNIQLNDGRIEFDDQPVQRRHVIEQLRIAVPFVSNLPTKIDIFETPNIEARVNGAAFKLAGKVKPFAVRREASLDLALRSFDLAPYLAYVPDGLPVRIERGRLATDLHLVWQEGGDAAQSLAVDGKAQLTDTAIRDASGAELIAFDSLAVDLEHIEPLAVPALVKIRRVDLDAPRLEAQRGADGRVNLQRLVTSGDQRVSANQSAPSATAAAQAPRVSIGKFEIRRGTVNWQDDAVPGGFKLVLSPLELQLSGLDLAGDTPAQLELKAQAATGESLEHSGQIIPGQGRLSGMVKAAGLSVERLRPYFSDAVGPARIEGSLGLQAEYAIEAKPAAPEIRIQNGSASLENLSVFRARDKLPLVKVSDLQVAGVTIDLAKRAMTIASIGSSGAQWRVARDTRGRINLLEAVMPATKPQHQRVSTRKPQAEGVPPWQVQLGRLQIENWNARFDDLSGSAPVALNLRDLGVEITDWSNQPGAMAAAAIQAGVNKKGRLAVAGRFGTEPVKADLKLDLRAVDLISIQPYVDKYFRVLVTRGAVTAKGSLGIDLSRPAQPRLRYTGTAALDDLNSLDRINDADFLRWKRFAATGIRFDLTPLALSVAEVRLQDFYTRLILDGAGRLNLRELAAGEPAGEAAAQSVPAARATERQQASASDRILPRISVGKFVLDRGQVNFSDRFVKPNYDANLREVSGTLSGLSTDQTSLAQLALRARLDGVSPVEVTGELNPFRRDSFLDIKASVRDVDLTGVSTYAAKYVGYGVEKGKLSMDLQYRIRDRKLTAENQVNLDQLTFGEKIDSPQATKLPVLFAVALLKNRRGEIDINLPISGTLDDPDFSVGGIIVRVVVNLITKAVTAPFALIGSMFGGGEELSSVEFLPGSAALTDATQNRLRTLAKALAERPALRLEIAGLTDPAQDRQGLKRVVLDGKLRALKAAAMVRRGEEVGEVDQLSIDSAEYPKLLESVYDNEKIPDKPRNALGFARKLPAEEMEKRLLAHFTVSDEEIQALAGRRAQAVHDWFVASGGIDSDRLFLLKSAQMSGGEARPASARVEFSLK